jgi:hypothetical protein
MKRPADRPYIEIMAMPPGGGLAGLSRALTERAAEAAVELSRTLLLVANPAPLPAVIKELERNQVAYLAHGALLFVGHPWVRQLLLGLGAIADPDDGVGEAAILRAPFFAVDEGDLVFSLVQKDEKDPRRQRAREARGLLSDLRRQRHRHTPGGVARELVERSAAPGVLGTMGNGAQHCAVLMATVAWIEWLAWHEDLDFDRLAQRLREIVGSGSLIRLPVSPAAGVLQIVPMSLAQQIDCDQVILCVTGLETLASEGWSCVPNGASLLITANPPAPRIVVRRRILVPSEGEREAAREALRRTWPEVDEERLQA